MEYLSSIDRSSYIIADYIKNGEKGELVPQVIAEKNDGKKYGELQQTDRQTDRQTDSK